MTLKRVVQSNGNDGMNKWGDGVIEIGQTRAPFGTGGSKS